MALDISKEPFTLPWPLASGTGFIIEITILTGSRAGTHLSFEDKENISIGRQSECDVNIQEPVVSSNHASIVRRGQNFILSDLGSTNGTWLLPNQEKVKETSLPASAQVQLGANGPICSISMGLTLAFGSYRLIGHLGGGGMAEVFLARQLGLGGFNRKVAIKLIQPSMFAVPDAERMFLDEARIAAEINHHNVIKIIEVGKQDNILYIAMELVRGLSLWSIFSGLYERGILLPPDLVAALMGQACAGLHALHELRDARGALLNAVHRDVSPTNLMCTSEGVLKVIDFGLARDRNRMEYSDGKGIKGKPSYMSPEQAQGQPLDRCSDLFAIGIMIHELCTGLSLFQRDTLMGTLGAVLTAEIPSLQSGCSEASPLLDLVTQRALERNISKRFGTAASLGAELVQVVKEAGGRFLNYESIATYLTDLGINLGGNQATLLLQAPQALVARWASRPPAVPAKPAVPAPLVSPARWEGRIVQGPHGQRYRLDHCLSPVRHSDRDIYKLNYQGVVVRQAPAAPPGDVTRPGPDTQVSISLIGVGADLASLPEAQFSRLSEFVQARQRLAEQGNRPNMPLAPIMDVGVVSDNGPAFVVFPRSPRTLASPEIQQAASTLDRLRLVERICAALASAVELEPGFVHGDLTPNAIAIDGHLSDPAIVLSDFSLERSLGLRASFEASDEVYRAPEQRTEPLPTQKSDVYSMAVLLYQLLSGENGQSQEQHSEPPRNENREKIPSYVDAVLRAALQTDPRMRPMPAEFLARLQPVALVESSTTPVSRIVAPPPGKEIRLHTPLHREVQVSNLLVHFSHVREPIPVPLSRIPGLLPAPLFLSVRGRSMALHVAQTKDSAGNAISIYLNAYDPKTRQDHYTLVPIATDATLDVGHRRQRVQKISFSSTFSERGMIRLEVELRQLQIHISTDTEAQRFITLSTVDPTTGVVYVSCITVHP